MFVDKVCFLGLSWKKKKKKEETHAVLDVSVFILQECQILISTSYKVFEVKQEGMES